MKINVGDRVKFRAYALTTDGNHVFPIMVHANVLTIDRECPRTLVYIQVVERGEQEPFWIPEHEILEVLPF